MVCTRTVGPSGPSSSRDGAGSRSAARPHPLPGLAEACKYRRCCITGSAGIVIVQEGNWTSARLEPDPPRRPVRMLAEHFSQLRRVTSSPSATPRFSRFAAQAPASPDAAPPGPVHLAPARRSRGWPGEVVRGYGGGLDGVVARPDLRLPPGRRVMVKGSRQAHRRLRSGWVPRHTGRPSVSSLPDYVTDDAGAYRCGSVCIRRGVIWTSSGEQVARVRSRDQSGGPVMRYASSGSRNSNRLDQDQECRGATCARQICGQPTAGTSASRPLQPSIPSIPSTPFSSLPFHSGQAH